MKKYILYCLLFFLTGCGAERDMAERAEAGVIGRDTAVTREMAAKTIALAFYTREELENVEKKSDFSDVTEEMWSDPYICACVEKGFFAGGEEGAFRPQDALTLWEAQVLMDRLAPDHESRILLTEENKNMAVSYELWGQLLETALKSRRGEDSLYSYGLQKREGVVLSVEGLLDTGKITAEGLDLTPYRYSR
ncbi:MAG: S-layer homology domain-containing protein, partial [Anaerotignum sp.]|nr:S-layer homology domain-containing protein [Anaerotignum sp.]